MIITGDSTSQTDAQALHMGSNHSVWLAFS